MVKDVISFIDQNYTKFAEDYQSTSQKDRYSTGKLERRLFLLLADLCNWNNGNDNALCASIILSDLGYHSYKMKEKRFRQKVENEKKKKKKSPKSKSGRYYKKRPTISRTREMEESYSEMEDTYNENYIPAMTNVSESYDATNPLHCIKKEEPSMITRSQKIFIPDKDGNHHLSTNEEDSNKDAAKDLQNSTETEYSCDSGKLVYNGENGCDVYNAVYSEEQENDEDRENCKQFSNVFGNDDIDYLSNPF